MLVIGLTGGIASGKSTVSKLLEELGAYVLDADKVGHEAYRPNTSTWKAVVAAFGKEVLKPDKEIDRGKLGAQVFKDTASMKKLTDIMWPRMHQMVKERIEEQKRLGTKVMVVEAAVLLEARWDPLVDEVWVTVAPEKAVIERLHKSKGMTEEQARARIGSQMSSEERIKRSNVIIHNDSGPKELRERVLGAWKVRTEKRR